MVQTGERLVNPHTGQTMIFRQTAEDTNGELFQCESFNEPHRPAEPEHTHPLQESSCEVLSGILTFRIAGVEHVLRAGDKVTIPAGVPHHFWNSGDDVAHHIGEFRPALRIQHFFETWFGLARDGKINDRGMPPFLQLMVLLPAFGNELRPTSPPWPLLRATSWVLGPIARLRGYRSEYPQYSGVSSKQAAN